jgi:hypothetical protein
VIIVNYSTGATESWKSVQENGFSQPSSESGASSHKEQHGDDDDFVEFCHALYSWAEDH